MKNSKEIRGGLRLLLGLGSNAESSVPNLASPELRTKAHIYELRHLLGVQCPHCSKRGTIASLQLRERRDIEIKNIPGKPADPSLRSELIALERISWNDYGFGPPEGGREQMDNHVREQIREEELLKEENSGWVCFACQQTVEPSLFVEQLMEKSTKV